MFNVPAPLYQSLVGSNLCPNPEATTSEELVARTVRNSFCSLAVGVVMGAAVALGMAADRQPAKAFSMLTAACLLPLLVRQTLVCRTNLFVLQNRARLGAQSPYSYKGPGHDC